MLVMGEGEWVPTGTASTPRDGARRGVAANAGV